jgi:hypothetical protein
MSDKVLKEEYKTPQISVRGVFFVENIAAIQSPVKGITFEDWSAGDEQEPGDGEFLMPLW